MYNIVIATDVNQKITKGLLYGMKGDTVYLSLKNEMIKLNLVIFSHFRSKIEEQVIAVLYMEH